MVKCPDCHGLYNSGIMTDIDMTDRDIGAEENVTTHCPFCGRKNLTGLEAMAYISVAPAA